MPKVKVKRKRQIAIPADLREKLGIIEGTILEVEERPQGTLLRPLPPAEPGDIVGEAEHRKLIEELDHVRRRWR